jgi:Chaperone of endosialidase
MEISKRVLFISFAVSTLMLAGATHAQVPSSNDTSDTNFNTGMGSGALGGPAATGMGLYNTAAGYHALHANNSGQYDSALGFGALAANTSGNYNTAIGFDAMQDNTSGVYNSAFGYYALPYSTTGQQNTALGVFAMFRNRTGGYNTASGVDALYYNTSGDYNIAEGYKAGINLTTGSNNIDIGNQGVAAESGMIRIGTSGKQTETFIAGINNSTVTGAEVVVDPNTGQLGVLASSERFKTAITPMGIESAKLDQLRPVSFKLKSDTTGTRQYGLIAEEVAKIYPELVIRDATGQINGVRYDELAPMLLNEVQQQKTKIAVMEQQLAQIKSALKNRPTP